MRKIAVFIREEQEIPKVAQLLGVPNEEVQRRYDEAKAKETACVFSSYVTEVQWGLIAKYKQQRKFT